MEIAALVAFAAFGWSIGSGWLSWILAVVLPLTGALIWGLFNVPNDPSRSGRAPVPGVLRLVLELTMFALAAVAMAASGWPIVAGAYAVLVVVHYAFAIPRIRWLIRQKPSRN